MTKWQLRATGFFIFIAALLPRVWELGRFIGPDELFIWKITNDFILAFLNGDFSGTIVRGYPGLGVMWIETIAVLLQYPFSQATLPELVGVDTPISLLGAKQLPLGIVHAGLVTLIWYWSRPIFGESVAIIAGLLTAFDPFLLAESRVIRIEALASETVCLAMLALLNYIQHPYRAWLFGSAGFAGLAIVTKSSSIFIIPVSGLALLLNSWWHGQKPLIIVRPYLEWLVTTCLTFVLLWPGMWVTPLAALQETLAFVLVRVIEGNTGQPNRFFMGNIYQNTPGRGFLLVATVYRVGLLILPGLLLLIISLFVRSYTWREKARFKLTLLVIYIVSYIGMLSLSTLQYDRYLLPIFPILNLMAALGLWHGSLDLLQRLTIPHRQTILATSLLPLFGLQIFTCWQSHPYYYTYYNPLLGGGEQAQHVLRVGHGEGLDLVADYINAQPDAAKLKIASAMSSKIGPWLTESDTIALHNLDGKWIQADFVFLYISQLQRRKHDQAIVDYLAHYEPVYTLNLNGIEYGRLHPGPAAQYHTASKLEGRATLYGYTFNQQTLSAGQPLTATIYFRNEGQQLSDLFYVRLTDRDEYEWAETTVQPRPAFETEFRQAERMVEGTISLTVPPGMLPGQYIIEMGYEQRNGQPIGRFSLPDEGDDIWITLPEKFSPQPPPDDLIQTKFSLHDELSLAGYHLSGPQFEPDKPMWLTLYWQALSDVSHDYVLALQLYNEADQEVAYWLGRPARSGLPTDQWRQHQLVQDPWLLTLPDDLPPGDYQLRLTVYNAETQDAVDTLPLQTIDLPNL